MPQCGKKEGNPGYNMTMTTCAEIEFHTGPSHQAQGHRGIPALCFCGENEHWILDTFPPRFACRGVLSQHYDWWEQDDNGPFLFMFTHTI